jgi:hypothetical protein
LLGVAEKSRRGMPDISSWALICPPSRCCRPCRSP